MNTMRIGTMEETAPAMMSEGLMPHHSPMYLVSPSGMVTYFSLMSMSSGVS